MDEYLAIKSRIASLPTAAVDLNLMHHLLLQEHGELLQFIASRDAELVALACNGLGTDDDLLIKVICNRTRAQLQQVDVYFRANDASRKTLRERVSSETSGNYGKFMCSIVQDRDVVNAAILKDAFDGLGCNTKVVNELFTTLSNEEIRGMRDAYERLTDSKLSDRLKSELSGEHEKLILNIMDRGRGEGALDKAAAAETAKLVTDIIKEGSGMLGGLSDKAVRKLIDQLVKQSPAQCREIAVSYEHLNPGKPSLTATLESKLSGALEEGMLGLFMDPIDQLCLKLKGATDGMGTDEDTITRIIGGKDKEKAKSIARRYQEKYNVDFRALIQREVGGNYQRAILTWLDGSDPTNGWAPATDGSVAAEIDRLIECIWNMRNQIAVLDYDILKKAAVGLGTNERMVVNVLCRRTKSHIDSIDMLFRQRENKTLRQYIVDEMGGNLEDFLEYTQMEEDEFDAIMLFEAFKGLGCDERAVVEIMTTRSWARLQAARLYLHNACSSLQYDNNLLFNNRVYYEARNDHSLMDALISELYGNLEYLCCRLLAGARGIAEKKGSNLTCSPEEYADKLYDAGAGKFGTDEKAFIDFITGHSLAEVQLVAAAYERRHSSSLEAAIQSEFSGNLKQALVNLLHDPIDVFARYIKDYCAGLGTYEEGLNRILAGNDKDTVTKIAARFLQKYDTTLEATLKSELSGDYEKACIAWIEPPSFSDGYLESIVERLNRSAAPPPPEPDLVPDEIPFIPPPKPESARPPVPPTSAVAEIALADKTPVLIHHEPPVVHHREDASPPPRSAPRKKNAKKAASSHMRIKIDINIGDIHRIARKGRRMKLF